MSAVLVLFVRIIIAVCLYVFAGYAIYTLWRELKYANERRVAEIIPSISINYLDSAEQTTTFSQNEITMGRETSNDLIISDETVSSHHAKLSHRHRQWWLEDLQSTNGTFLNNERIYTPTVIVSGDEVILGNVSLLIMISSIK
ncbi:MAG: FHA domain-containing protein [Chloroflexi bacterium]|nr:FHA domain-containing protein [Chloroflexota bacterium]